jgi:hypothetical protein
MSPHIWNDEAISFAQSSRGRFPYRHRRIDAYYIALFDEQLACLVA